MTRNFRKDQTVQVKKSALRQSGKRDSERGTMQLTTRDGAALSTLIRDGAVLSSVRFQPTLN